MSGNGLLLDSTKPFPELMVNNLPNIKMGLDSISTNAGMKITFLMQAFSLEENLIIPPSSAKLKWYTGLPSWFICLCVCPSGYPSVDRIMSTMYTTLLGASLDFQGQIINYFNSGTGCLIWMKQKGYKWIQYWTLCMISNFNPTHDLDFGFWRSSISGVDGSWFIWNF